MKIAEYRELVRRAKAKKPKAKAKAKAEPKIQAKTQTEAMFERRHLADRLHLFQPPPFTITRTTKRRYTADFETILKDGRMMVIEVKGSYRLQSHDRARLAWEIAAEANPGCVFVWAALNKKTHRFDLETWEHGGRTVLFPTTLPA